jgi:hypothetical protein
VAFGSDGRWAGVCRLTLTALCWRVCDGRAGGATTDAWRQRPLAVTSAASQASDCVGRGHESVAAPTNTSVVLGRTHTLLDCVCWCDGRWGYSRQTRLLIGVLTVGTSNAQDTWRLRVRWTRPTTSVAPDQGITATPSVFCYK